MSAPQVGRLFRYIDGLGKPRPAVLVAVNSEGFFLRVSFMDVKLKPEAIEVWQQGKRLGQDFDLDKDSKVAVPFVKLISASDYQEELSHELGVCHVEILYEIRCILVQHRVYLNPREREVVNKNLRRWQERCSDDDPQA